MNFTITPKENGRLKLRSRVCISGLVDLSNPKSKKVYLQLLIKNKWAKPRHKMFSDGRSAEDQYGYRHSY